MLAATHHQRGEKVDLFKYDFLFYVESFETCLTFADIRFSMNLEVKFLELGFENEKALRVPLGSGVQ